MSRSTDPDHFFQTSHSQAETKRRALKSKNENGRPIRLNGKILAVIADPADAGAVYVAQSVGTARRVVLETGTTSHLYSGPTAPMTSLALNPTRDTLFAGCWDKSIWSWSTSTKHPSRRYSGHTDFVKAVLCLQIAHTNVLISGSADACIIIWNVGTGEKLHKLKGGHTRGILHLAVDPLTYPIQPFPSENGEEEVKENIMVLFSAGSDREIRRWRLSTDLSSAGEIDTENPIIQHETSVFALKFDTDEDLWTASADGTVKCLNRERGWEVDTTLNHGDYVDAVVVEPQGTWVVSAGRDEEVKVWDCSTGDLHCTYSGHFEEITGLVLRGQTIVSVSIDATIRQWSLKAEDMSRVIAEKKDKENGWESEGNRYVTNFQDIDSDEETELDQLMAQE